MEMQLKFGKSIEKALLDENFEEKKHHKLQKGSKFRKKQLHHYPK